MNFKKSIRRVAIALCVMMTISAFILVPAFATEEPTDFGQYYGIIRATSLNVRDGASEEAEVKGELFYGTYVEVFWQEPGWVCIPYGDGEIGYVSADYVEVCPGQKPDFATGGSTSVVEVAAKYLGVPYVFGGTTPGGFDCSGLVQYVYGELGYSINRVAADQMLNGIPVSRAELAPGDIIGFYSSPGGGYVGHVGIYVGDGMMIHAPHTGDIVKYTSIDSSYYASRFAGGRRIIY